MTGIGAISAAASNVVQAQVQKQLRPQPAAEESSTSLFSDMLHSMAQQTASLDQKAAQSVTGLLTGQGVDVHEAMIATQKADLAFELALQVRNKAVSAYQQMMQMQF